MKIRQKKYDTAYLPVRAEIAEARYLGNDVKLLRVTPGKKTGYIPGQFFMVGVWGAGEVPISVTSVQKTWRNMEFAIRKVGSVTTALHRLKKGDTLWIRGPYGNGFDIGAARKRDVLFIAGGIGIVPLRPLVNTILAQRRQGNKVFLLYGSKNPSSILFQQDIRAWQKKGVEVILTIDVKNRTWKGNVGVVTEHLDTIQADFRDSCAFVCGPEIMIDRTMKELSLRGMPGRRIITTLEARMKCGMGKCGQCYRGTEYVCTNGPVYSYEEIMKRKVSGP
jgi:NAD(P)H-flavin reductase